MSATRRSTRFLRTCAAVLVGVGLSAHAASGQTETLRFGVAVHSKPMLEQSVITPLARQIAWRSAGALRLENAAVSASTSETLAALERGEIDLAFVRIDEAPERFPHHWVIAELGRLGDARVSGALHQKLVDRGVLCGYAKYQVLAAATLEGTVSPGVLLVMNPERYEALPDPLKDVLDGFDRHWLPERMAAAQGGKEAARATTARTAGEGWKSMEGRHPGGRFIDRIVEESMRTMARAD